MGNTLCMSHPRLTSFKRKSAPLKSKLGDTETTETTEATEPTEPTEPNS